MFVVAGSTIWAAKRMARSDIVTSNAQALVLAIEMYKRDHGTYPSSLNTLMFESAQEIRELLDQGRILHDAFHDVYQYELRTNGFIIFITAPPWFFMHYDRIAITNVTGTTLSAGVIETFK